MANHRSPLLILGIFISSILTDYSSVGMDVLNAQNAERCFGENEPLYVYGINETAYVYFSYSELGRLNIVKPGVCSVILDARSSDDDDDDDNDDDSYNGDDRYKIIVESENIKLGSGNNYVAVYDPVTGRRENWSSETPQCKWSASSSCETYVSGGRRVRVGFHLLNPSISFCIHIIISARFVTKYDIHVHRESPTKGYIQGSLDSGKMLKNTEIYEGQRLLVLPKEHAVMMSLLRKPAPHIIQLAVYSGTRVSMNKLLFSSMRQGGSTKTQKTVWIRPQSVVDLAESVLVRFVAYLNAFSSCVGDCTATYIRYSFYKKSAIPQLTPQNLWNCSVSWLKDFEDHLGLCDVTTDCYGGEDEADCGYDTCSPHGIAASGRCYVLLKARALTPTEARKLCATINSSLAVLNTKSKWTGVIRVLRQFQVRHYFSLGLTSRRSIFSNTYTLTHQWSDDSMFFFPVINKAQMTLKYGEYKTGKVCAWGKFHLQGNQPVVLTHGCAKQVPAGHPLCEVHSPWRSSFSRPEIRSKIQANKPLVECPDGHSTHPFLACDIQSRCWATSNQQYGADRHVWDIPSSSACTWNATSLPPSFACTRGGQRVPYSLVCDHRQDCQDNSDEDFCHFPSCPPQASSQCQNKQCVPAETRCDGTFHCLDGSDEQTCKYLGYQLAFKEDIFNNWRQKVEFTSLKKFMLVDHWVINEDTHFVCPGTELYLAVYFLCNGIFDCPGHEDEDDCGSYSCPGYYRCRGSRICVHSWDVCDGTPQCPEFDDEMFCHLNCPRANCTCYGHALSCRGWFEARLYPGLRYLNAAGSGMTPGMLSHNTLLIHLSLARCGLTSLGKLSLRNLRSLDISSNLLKEFSLLELSNLQLYALFLADNPLTSAFLSSSLRNSSVRFPGLKTLDMSLVPMQEFDSYSLSPFSNVQHLNLSFCGIRRVVRDFGFLKNIRTIDFRGSELLHFSREMLVSSERLDSVRGDTYRLCCKSVLPPGFNRKHCYAPQSKLATCQSLLGSDVYFYAMIVYAVLILLGNLGIFVFRVFLKKSGRLASYGVVLTHLSVSDLLSGLHLVLVLTVDALHRGHHVWNDTAWRHGAGCHLAGVFSALSRQVSTLLLVILTLDRGVVLGCHVTLSSLAVYGVCAAAWTLGFVLAVVPWVFSESVSASYSRLGICVLVPSSGNVLSSSSLYVTAVNTVMPLMLFSVMGLSLGYAYFQIKTHPFSFVNASTESSNLDIARRLLPMGFTSIVCGVSLSLRPLVSAQGLLQVSEEVQVGVLVFLEPLSSLLNPYLYGYGLLAEQQRSVHRQRLLQRLRAKKRAEH